MHSPGLGARDRRWWPKQTQFLAFMELLGRDLKEVKEQSVWYPRKECSRQREQQLQRPWDRTASAGKQWAVRKTMLQAAAELTKDGNESWGGQGGARADPLALSNSASIQWVLSKRTLIFETFDSYPDVEPLILVLTGAVQTIMIIIKLCVCWALAVYLNTLGGSHH